MERTRMTRIRAATLIVMASVVPASEVSGGEVRAYRSPDGSLNASVIPLRQSPTASEEDSIKIETSDGTLIVVQSYGSSDGEHGYGVEQAAWTGDSRYFLYSLSSSGGHQAWHFPTDVIELSSRKTYRLDDFVGPITDPGFRVLNDDVVQVVGRSKEALEEVTSRIKLSELANRVDTASEGASGAWPGILEFQCTINISTADRIRFSIPLRTENGDTVYTLFGTGGSDAYLDSLGDAIGINFVGPLQIRLVLGTEDSETSLLAEDGSPPWYTRGQVQYSQLLGACRDYPEYGALRHFRLRHIELTLKFANIETGLDGQPTNTNLEISVRPCPECTTPQAEQPGYLDPAVAGRSCDEVKVGNDPIVRRGDHSWHQE